MALHSRKLTYILTMVPWKTIFLYQPPGVVRFHGSLPGCNYTEERESILPNNTPKHQTTTHCWMSVATLHAAIIEENSLAPGMTSFLYKQAVVR